MRPSKVPGDGGRACVWKGAPRREEGSRGPGREWSVTAVDMTAIHVLQVRTLRPWIRLSAQLISEGV